VNQAINTFAEVAHAMRTIQNIPGITKPIQAAEEEEEEDPNPTPPPNAPFTTMEAGPLTWAYDPKTGNPNWTMIALANLPKAGKAATDFMKTLAEMQRSQGQIGVSAPSPFQQYAQPQALPSPAPQASPATNGAVHGTTPYVPPTSFVPTSDMIPR
jgi:hypothetical protein